MEMACLFVGVFFYAYHLPIQVQLPQVTLVGRELSLHSPLYPSASHTVGTHGYLMNTESLFSKEPMREVSHPLIDERTGA